MPINNNNTFNIKKNIDSLNGLRAFACLLVVFGHLAKEEIILDIKGSGQLGVMLFFVLSGFLMAHLYAIETITGKRAIEYGFRRCFRVLPAYVTILSLSYFLTPYWSHFPYPMDIDNLIRHLKLQGDTSVFWTIPVEMKFYLFFPALWIVLGFLKKTGYKSLFMFVLFIAVLNIFPLASSTRLDLSKSIDFFIGGVCVGFLHQHIVINAAWQKWFVNSAFVLSVALIIVFIPQNFLKLTGLIHPMWLIPQVLAPLFAICVLSAANLTGAVRTILSNRAAQFLGKISFSLYLVHFPIIVWINDSLLLGPVPALVKVILAISISVLVANLVYLTIEEPFRKGGAALNNITQQRIA